LSETGSHAAPKGPGRKRALRPVDLRPEELIPFLKRLARLRVITAWQARQLFEPYGRRHISNVFRAFDKYERRGYLRCALLRPSEGARSRHFYSPTPKGLRLLGLEASRSLVLRPPQHVLEYLVFRNEVYATARANGWLVGSPILSRPKDRPQFLELFRRWATGTKAAQLAQAKAGAFAAAEVLRLEQDLERLPRFLPTELTFELLVRVSTGLVPTALVLLLIDDVRRSVERQVEALPAAYDGLSICLKDSQSRYDTARRELYWTSPRLKRWRCALAARYGDEVLETDTLFPDLWARRLAMPRAEAMSRTPTWLGDSRGDAG
jgi:hypothetical protein